MRQHIHQFVDSSKLQVLRRSRLKYAGAINTGNGISSCIIQNVWFKMWFEIFSSKCIKWTIKLHHIPNPRFFLIMSSRNIYFYTYNKWWYHFLKNWIWKLNVVCLLIFILKLSLIVIFSAFRCLTFHRQNSIPLNFSHYIRHTSV